MNVRIKKLWWSIPLLLALAAIVYYGYLQQSPAPSVILSFRIRTEDTAETISAWYDNEGTYYVFLPSYADIRTVTASVDPACRVEVADTALTEDTDLSVFTMGSLYDIRITQGGETDKKQICFFQSANTAAMFIDTRSGSTGRLLGDKNYKEPSAVRLFTAGGIIDYRTTAKPDYLRGRGNSTWGKDKKPFNLYLGQAADLLGMDRAEEWVLLANAYDKTNLRNKLIQDFAGSIGPYDGFACDCQYVDLFVNGEYFGLYLLSEKVEAAYHRLGPGRNDVLFALHQPQKVDNFKSAIKWNDEVYVEIHWPEAPGTEQIDRLRERLMAFQTSANSSDGQMEDTLGRYIDYDSWAGKFLVDQIFSNCDAMIDSSYFWFNPEDSKIYAGPCWDYDLTAGISFFPGRISPAVPPGQDLWGDEYTWYASLWNNKAFREALFETYRSVFVPRLKELLGKTIGSTAETISRASEMNSIRWKKMFEGSKTWSDDAAGFSDHIQNRMAFLESLWLCSVNYHTITMKLPDSGIRFLYAVSGAVCDDLPSPEELGIEGSSVWYREDNGQPFNRSSVITEDLTLFVKEKERAESTAATLYNSHYEAMVVGLACAGLLCLGLPALIWADLRRNGITR